MVETVCYVDVALWCVPVTLEFSQGEYGASTVRGVVKHQLNLGTLIELSWPL